MEKALLQVPAPGEVRRVVTTENAILVQVPTWLWNSLPRDSCLVPSLWLSWNLAKTLFLSQQHLEVNHIAYPFELHFIIYMSCPEDKVKTVVA